MLLLLIMSSRVVFTIHLNDLKITPSYYFFAITNIIVNLILILIIMIYIYIFIYKFLETSIVYGIVYAIIMMAMAMAMWLLTRRRVHDSHLPASSLLPPLHIRSLKGLHSGD